MEVTNKAHAKKIALGHSRSLGLQARWSPRSLHKSQIRQDARVIPACYGQLMGKRKRATLTESDRAGIRSPDSLHRNRCAFGIFQMTAKHRVMNVDNDTSSGLAKRGGEWGKQRGMQN
jgi:hypothetical protein